jgi:L-glutamine-phosphate cytidylyltransferase
MNAIILAAGRGSRMGATTSNAPKCLTRLAGKPLLHWQLSALRAAGVQDVAVVRGYLADQLVAHDFHTFDNPRWSQSNMVVTLTCAEPWLSAHTCLISYADIVYHPDIIGQLISAPGDIVIAYDRLWHFLWEERFENPLADAETFQADPDGRLRDIGRRPGNKSEVQGQYMGLLKFTAAGWRRIQKSLDALSPEAKDKLDMTSLLRRLLDEGVRIETVPVSGRWCEVDSERDLALYHRLLGESNMWSHDWRWNGARPR